jgi:hypothetical protein
MIENAELFYFYDKYLIFEIYMSICYNWGYRRATEDSLTFNLFSTGKLKPQHTPSLLMKSRRFGKTVPWEIRGRPVAVR